MEPVSNQQRFRTLAPPSPLVNRFLRKFGFLRSARTRAIASRISFILAHPMMAPGARGVFRSCKLPSPSSGLLLILSAVIAFTSAGAARNTAMQERTPAGVVAPDLITNIPGRARISLNGKWKAIVDPYATGFGMRLYENRKPRVSGFDDSNPEVKESSAATTATPGAGETPFDCAPFLRQGEHDKPALRISFQGLNLLARQAGHYTLQP
jgi:hypothetical protein